MHRDRDSSAGDLRVRALAHDPAWLLHISGLVHSQEGIEMPEKATKERALRAKRSGKAPSTQAGEFVREEIHHVREGKHGAKSAKQAIAIGLSKARRAGVPLKPKAAKAGARRSASRRGGTKASPRRSQAIKRALKRQPRRAASHTALSRQAHSAARSRTKASRSAAAKRAARTRARAAR